jgi:translation initiation factor 3 subunit D
MSCVCAHTFAFIPNTTIDPWDIVVQKLANGTLFFDKRDNSQFDFLTVHETSYTPPSEEDGINSPTRLGLEATVANHNLTQQILKTTGRVEMDIPNPFIDEDNADGMEPASVAFRYRKFALDDRTTLVCRTELHGIVKKTQYMTAFALNEYVPPSTSSSGTSSGQTSNPQLISWRDKIDSQRGAVLATELKNNSFKLAKWTAQSLLASADQMKIGFVSRTNPKIHDEHVILATQFYRPKDFAQQITLSENQMWALFRMFVGLFQKRPEGKYVLMRDPNKAVVHLYKVPDDTFDDDE